MRQVVGRISSRRDGTAKEIYRTLRSRLSKIIRTNDTDKSRASPRRLRQGYRIVRGTVFATRKQQRGDSR